MKRLPLRFATLAVVLFFAAAITPGATLQAQSSGKLLRIAVAGATHGHVPWILRKKNDKTVELVGVFETDTALVRRLAKQYNLPSSLFYTDLAAMLNKVKPEAVVAFGSIYNHAAVVEACAPRGIHVMVEKPLATNMQHAQRMAQLAATHNIHLLTNFETSWYATTEKTNRLVHDSNYVGKIRKVVIHDGHNGPKEIGVNPEFFKWLTDPVQNGGGALIDFGCYGANLMTYLMKGEEPISVMASTRQFKPGIYPKVDDDATIVVNYPTAQCIIQASWNWPFSRKDMEVYGETGYVFADNSTDMRLRNRNDKGERTLKVQAKEVDVYEDPFDYLAAVIRSTIKMPAYGLYALDNNVTVVRILEAARQSAATGKVVQFKK